MNAQPRCQRLTASKEVLLSRFKGKNAGPKAKYKDVTNNRPGHVYQGLKHPFRWAGSCFVCVTTFEAQQPILNFGGLDSSCFFPQRSNSSGNSGLTPNILFFRKVLSQSLRCAVLFIVKTPQIIQESAAPLVQVMLEKGKLISFLVLHCYGGCCVLSTMRPSLPSQTGLHFTFVSVKILERKLLWVAVSDWLLCAQHDWDYAL